MHDFLVLRTSSCLSTTLLLLSLSSACADNKSSLANDDSPAEAGQDGGNNKPSLDGGTGHDASKPVSAPDASSSDGGHKSDASSSSLDASTDASSSPVADAGRTSSLPPFPTNGEVLKATDKKWTYIEFPDTQCRDGSKAGIALSLNSSSKKLMIFLEGGGACFDWLSCPSNPANTSTMQAEQTAGIWDRSNTLNPVRDWNFVYVPYCTGDTHGGAKPNGMVEGVVGPQQFVGYLNMQKFLNRIVPTFNDATDVLLTGISAGGFGAAQNAVLVQRAFSNVKVRTVDDSGPPLSKTAIAPCLQDKWRTTWGLDQSYLSDCGADCPNKDDFAQDYGLFLAKTFADRSSGLIESSQDSVISSFFGAGLNNCTGIWLLTPVAGDVFQQDLLALREKLRPYSSFSTYIPTGTQHTWLSSPSFYTGTAGSTKLVDWFTKIVNDEVPGHVGP